MDTIPLRPNDGHRPSTSTQTRLRGRWLHLARLIWVITLLVSVSLFIASLPIRMRQLSEPCESEPCFPLQATTIGAAELTQLGIPLSGFAITIVFVDTLFGLMFAGSGIIIFWRRSDDRVAILVSLMLILFGLTTPPGVLAAVRELPLLRNAIIIVQAFAFSAIPIVSFIFPNGQFVPRWTRWVALIIGVINLIASAVGQLYHPIVVGLFACDAGLALWAQIYRYRKVSGPVERQQTKWVVVGFGVAFVGIFLLIAPPLVLPGLVSSFDSPLSSLADFIYRVPYGFFFGFIPLFALPVTFAISVLRYRLWDVDPVINRSLVYGALTVFLGIVFAGGFFALRALLGLILGGQQVVIAAIISTGVVVGLFSPARKALQRFVDKRFYDIRVDYVSAHSPAQLPGMTGMQLGGYEILKPLGRGGMAEVYLGRHSVLDRMVAIKVLAPALADDADFRRRFEREARVLSMLKHPHIVQMHDFGSTSGIYYIIMEYFAGKDLSTVLRETGPLPIEYTCQIVQEIASALDYAHQQGLIHRDIKPSNVMLEPTTSLTDSESRAVLMDFGIARMVSGGTKLTASGMIGTIDYIAPEQIRDAKDIDGRADIYSLGVMMFQMLTGRLPFVTSNPGALLIAHMNQPAPDPCTLRADLPDEIGEVVLRALEKDPARRFDTAGQFAAELPAVRIPA